MGIFGKWDELTVLVSLLSFYKNDVLAALKIGSRLQTK